MSMRTILWWLFWLFLAWFVITQPANAAHAVHHIGAFFTRAANGISSFFANL